MIDPPVRRRTMRELNAHLRTERLLEFRRTATRIIATDGLEALTMHRLADEMGCAIGSLYRYFPSKDALIAELQQEAIDRLGISFVLSQAHLDDVLDDVVDGCGRPAARFAALARVVTATRFWIAAESVFPQEIELSRRTFTDPVVATERGTGPVPPAGMRLLAVASGLLDDAVAAGAFRPAPNVDRAVVVIAGTTGVLTTSKAARWHRGGFDGRRLAAGLARDLFVSWGATPAELDAVDDLVAGLAEHDRLVPTIGPG